MARCVVTERRTNINVSNACHFVFFCLFCVSRSAASLPQLSMDSGRRAVRIELQIYIEYRHVRLFGRRFYLRHLLSTHFGSHFFLNTKRLQAVLVWRRFHILLSGRREIHPEKIIVQKETNIYVFMVDIYINTHFLVKTYLVVFYNKSPLLTMSLCFIPSLYHISFTKHLPPIHQPNANDFLRNI